jgi:hypothetical protein
MPELAQAPPPSKLPGEGPSARPLSTRARKRTRSFGAASKLAWVPRGDLGHTEWLAAGRHLGAIGRCSQWWVGDWLRYGTSRWGEKYAVAARVTGYDVASLRNMAWVASRFDLSLRNDKLTWSHHVLLAPLDADERREWLRRACAEGLSVSGLRSALRAARDPGRSVAGDGAAKGEDRVCPHCGHELRSAGD